MVGNDVPVITSTSIFDNSLGGPCDRCAALSCSGAAGDSIDGGVVNDCCRSQDGCDRLAALTALVAAAFSDGSTCAAAGRLFVTLGHPRFWMANERNKKRLVGASLRFRTFPTRPGCYRD